MALVLNEEQTLLRDAAESFFREKAPVSALRQLRDTRDADGFSRDLWRDMAELGWCGTLVPAEFGGLGCGLTEIAVIMQAAGRTLAATPLLSTLLLGAACIASAGSEQQKSELLGKVTGGDLLLALALQEGSHHNLAAISSTATPAGDNYVIEGRKVHVADGHVADLLLVAARTSGSTGEETGISLFLVDPATPGVAIERRSMVDSRNFAEIRLEGVEVPGENLLGGLHGGFAVLSDVIDRANIALCAEMLGSLQAAFDRTLDYLKQREQFGELIGTFQALQHRAAQMFCEIELSRSVVMQALTAADQASEDVALLASLAKVQVSETFRLVSNESIQMFGGIGMTDEEEIGFYLKRARVAQQMFGDEHYHLQRYALLRGY